MRPRLAVVLLPFLVALAGEGCGARTNLHCPREQPFGSGPNLYFVIDRSGSMERFNRWEGVRSAISNLVTNVGSRARFGAAMFPSDEKCGPGVEVMPLQPGDDPPGTPGPATASFLAATDRVPKGGTPLASTLEALAPKLFALPGKTFVIVLTDGGPNCHTGLRCGVDRCTRNIERVDFSCEPGGFHNCCDPTDFSEKYGAPGCLDDESSIAAVKKLAAGGIETFIVGVKGTEPYELPLARMAEAGGTARDDGAHRYYLAGADANELAKVLQDLALTLQRSSCTMPLPVPRPLALLVKVDGALVDDWQVDQSYLALGVRTCEALRAGRDVTVRFEDRCAGR